MINGGFMRRGQLLDGCTVLKDYADIKVRITHGRADYVCQPQVRVQIILHARTHSVRKYQSCMFVNVGFIVYAPVRLRTGSQRHWKG